MKLTKEHPDQLAAVVPLDTEALDTEALRTTYRSGQFHNADKVKDLNKRYRWDLLWLLKLDLTEIYKYANDSHIDTVLRKLVKPL